MRGMIEYMKAEREAEKEVRKEASRTKETPKSESGAGAAEEQPTRRTQQAVPKCPWASVFKGEPSQRKGKKRT